MPVKVCWIVIGDESISRGVDESCVGSGLVTLDAVMLEEARDIWTSGDSYDDRVAALTTSLLVPNSTVLDDDDSDTLRGQNGIDLFFARLSGDDDDNLKDVRVNEDVFELL